MSFDNALFYANAPENLRKAQIKLGKYIQFYRILSDAEANAKFNYTEAIKRQMEELRENNPPSSLHSMAKIYCAQQEKELDKATARKNKAKYLIDATKEALYNIRHLSKQIEHQVKGGHND